MAKNPSFQFYASDFLTDTNAWDAIEVGIYIRLLSTQWVNGFLVNDEERLARISGVDLQTFKKAWVLIGFKFALQNENVLRNPKLEEIRQKRETYLERQSSNGKKGGRPPKITQTEPKENPSLSSGLSQTQSQKKPLEDEDEIEEELIVEEEKKEPFEKIELGAMDDSGLLYVQGKFLIPEMVSIFKEHVPTYPDDPQLDNGPMGEIIRVLRKQLDIRPDPSHDDNAGDQIKAAWRKIAEYIGKDTFHRTQTLLTVSRYIQSIMQKALAPAKQDEKKMSKAEKNFLAAEEAKAKIAEFYEQRNNQTQ